MSGEKNFWNDINHYKQKIFFINILIHTVLTSYKHINLKLSTDEFFWKNLNFL